MQYISHYRSPLGGMLPAADEQGLTGLWFEGQKYFALHLIDGETEEREIPLFGEVKRWLDIYFSGKEPDFKVPLHLQGTAFQREVWEILCGIPYGKTVTYGEIAGKVTQNRRNLQISSKTPSYASARTSPRAVGGAVGHNPVSVIVPCHRVIGADGSLTGYAGGTDRKVKLLKLENVDLNLLNEEKNR